MHGKPPPGKQFDICERTFQFALRALHRWSNFVRVESDIRQISGIRNILSAMIRRIDEVA